MVRRILASLLVLAPALFAEAPPLTFIRSQADGLQTLSQEYKTADGAGPSIWLIGVSHLGTPEYYAALQKRLDAQTAVLFEGVGGDRMAQGAKLDNSTGLQSQLAKAIGLVFQLDAIDYHRANFKNSDLTPEALNHAIERRAEAKPSEPAKPTTKEPPAKVDNQTFKQLMGALHGEGEMAAQLGSMVTLMGSTPEMRETTKLMLVEALSQAGELIEMAKAMSPEIKDLFDVLITERNAEVVRQLDSQVSKLRAGQSVAVFYGAAHMDEIARRLTHDLHYTPAAQQWDTAFAADASKSIMPAAQMKMLIKMMRTQMKNGGTDGKLPDLPLFNLPPPGKK